MWDRVVHPELDKVETIEQFPVSTPKKQVRQFLDLAGYYRWFIPKFACIAVPLTHLTRKDEPVRVKWSKECDTGFRRLKAMLVSNHVLGSPDVSLPFMLETDCLTGEWVLSSPKWTQWEKSAQWPLFGSSYPVRRSTLP